MAESRKLVRNTSKDVSRIVSAASTAGFKLAAVDAQWAWEFHSRTAMATDWVDVATYSDEMIVQIMKHHLLDRPNS